jgi:predicted Fe-Mo cluster-binding NifX family protein
MAVAGKNGVVAEHFGHAKEFLIYEASPAGVRFMSHRKTELYCGGMDACGDGDVAEEGSTESLLDRNIRVLEGCEVVLCSKVGYEPWAKLEAAGIAPNGEHAMEPIEEAVMAVYKEIAATGKLSPRLKPERWPDHGPANHRILRQLLGLRRCLPERCDLRGQAAFPDRRRQMHRVPGRSRRAAMRRDLPDRNGHRR